MRSYLGLKKVFDQTGEAVTLGGGGGEHFFVVDRAHAQTGGLVGDTGDRGAFQAEAGGGFQFTRRRHADSVNAKRAQGTNLGRRLVAGAGDLGVRAGLEHDAGVIGGPAESLQQPRRARIRKPRTVSPPRLRIGPGAVADDRHQIASTQIGANAAGRIGDQERLDPELTCHVDRPQHAAPRMAFVVVQAAREDEHFLACPRADTQRTTMPLDRRDRQVGNGAEWQLICITKAIREITQAGAQDDGESRPATLHVGDKLREIVRHGRGGVYRMDSPTATVPGQCPPWRKGLSMGSTTRSSIALVVCTGTLLLLAGCPAQQEVGPPKVDESALAAARTKGKEAAEQDLKNGILKQKEFPPLPYSLQQMKFIKLLKSECGVEWEVVHGPHESKELRAEVDGYNAVMAGELRNRFGLDIFERLYQKAEEK